MDSGESGGINNRFRTSRADDLMVDVTGNLRIGESRKVVVCHDALAEGLMNGLAEGVVEIGLFTED